MVLRYFAASRGAMPFERTSFPGLTVVGHVEAGTTTVELGSRKDWIAQEDNSILFPMGLADDGFLHVSSLTLNPYLDVDVICTSSTDQRAHRSYFPKPARHANCIWHQDLERRACSLAPTSARHPHA